MAPLIVSVAGELPLLVMPKLPAVELASPFSAPWGIDSKELICWLKPPKSSVGSLVPLKGKLNTTSVVCGRAVLLPRMTVPLPAIIVVPV